MSTAHVLRMIVGRLHVSTPDRVVRLHVRSKLARDTAPEVARRVVAMAVRIHHANQRLYAGVMSGRL